MSIKSLKHWDSAQQIPNLLEICIVFVRLKSTSFLVSMKQVVELICKRQIQALYDIHQYFHNENLKPLCDQSLIRREAFRAWNLPHDRDYVIDEINWLTSRDVNLPEDISKAACVICEPNPTFGVLISVQNQFFFMLEIVEFEGMSLLYHEIANVVGAFQLARAPYYLNIIEWTSSYWIICNVIINNKLFTACAHFVKGSSLVNKQKKVKMAEEFVDKNIQEHKVVVFSKLNCPFCDKAKKLLTELSAEFEVIELNEINDGVNIQNALQEKTGQATVPNIFIDGKFVGGCSDLNLLNKKGELIGMLKACGAVK
uniref:Glutaredoxin putative n=1 Tax=Albugo laibachii Nc14 TaxID=890382 RepID=F0W0Y7_9STRA|nr:glutaredoxin putative [Albugo laibachii Nc14]|eukprot:CCA14711.1 glutaredoxin putative [Albugo laibachii Nc14]